MNSNGCYFKQRCHSSFIERNSCFFNTRLNLNIRMIIDIPVFEFSNTCTVGASMAVVRLMSMEALILSVMVYTNPSQPLASGCVLECLPATACGPTAPGSGCRPSVIVPALAHRRPPMSHRLNFTPYIASYIFL